MMEALVNGRVLLESGFVQGQAVLLEGDRIAAIVVEDDPRVGQAARRDLGGATLLPGFIDVQVNGGGGVLFNDDPSVEAIRTIGEAHRRFGTTAFLPTLITDELSVLERAIGAARSAIAARVPGAIGVHLEGPFLNVARKGTHDGTKIRRLEAPHVALLASLGNGPTVVTLAPENVAPEVLQRLADAGVLVSAGHTDATYEQMAAALQGGVRGFTHLFNAMSPFQHRAPGAVGAALLDASAWCGLIVDNWHVSTAALQVALRLRPRDRFMLVTDAMPNVGSAQGHFLLQGKRCTVKDGLVVDEAGVISGSALDMASAVRNAARIPGLDLAESARMASTYPAAFLRLDAEMGRIAPGLRANLTLVDDDVEVLDTWIDGRSTAA